MNLFVFNEMLVAKFPLRNYWRGFSQPAHSTMARSLTNRCVDTPAAFHPTCATVFNNHKF